MWKLSLAGLSLSLLLSGQCWGIAGARPLNSLIEEFKAKGNAHKAYVYERFSNATGLIAVVDDDPVSTQKGGQGLTSLVFTQFDQTQCSAVHFSEPAFFITSAVCFADAEGKLDSNRQYGKVFVQGKGWTIDPLSIVIHEKFQGKAKDDVAIFSLEPTEIAEFDRAHFPLELVSESHWLAAGQRTYFVAYGSKRGDVKSFGEAQLKQMMHVAPPKSEQIAPGSKLSIQPGEPNLVFISDDISPGLNCLYDSGGAAIIEAYLPDQEAAQYFLVGNILGRIAPSKDPVPCEKADRYAVASDLRYYSKWAKEAIEVSRQGQAQAAKIAAEITDWRNSFYGPNHPFSLWVPTRSEFLNKIIDKHRRLPRHQWSGALHEFMLHEQKRRESRSHLVGSSASLGTIAASPTPFTIPTNPWEPHWGGWVAGVIASNSPGSFTNPKGATAVTHLRIVNLGEGRTQFDYVLGTTSRRGDRTYLQTATSLDPGKFVDINIPTALVEKFWVHAPKGDAKGLIAYLTLGSEAQTQGAVANLAALERQEFAQRYGNTQTSTPTRQYIAPERSSSSSKSKPKKRREEPDDSDLPQWARDWRAKGGEFKHTDGTWRSYPQRGVIYDRVVPWDSD